MPRLLRLFRLRDMAPVRIACRDWNDGEIFDWYKRQPYTTVSKLELRKERDRFRHEYIVIYLDNGWIHRIDRRPIRQGNMEFISKEGCEAEDSLTPVSDGDLEDIRSTTDVEITLEFPSNKPDLSNVLAVAVAIHLHSRARNYTLQQYNCYFVARSIIALVTRYCILREPLLTGLRWDRVTEPAIFDYIFGGDRNKLMTLMKSSISAVLDDLLWDIIKEDAGTRIENDKDWYRLQDIVRRVVREEVERSSETLAIHDVQTAVNKWIIDATRATLWHENIDRGLSDRQYTERLEATVKDVMKMPLIPELVKQLPGNQIPSAKLIDLPPEMLARVPARVLEKIPDDLIAKLPYDTFRNAPAELWQKLSVQIFAKTRDAMVLTLPDDLSLVPQRLLDVSLQRMQVLLDQPKDHPDRVFALALLRRLPSERLTRLGPSYVAMRDLEAREEQDISTDHEMGKKQTVDELVPTKPQRLPLGHLKRRWDEASFIGLIIRFTPMPILKRVPPRIMDLLPDSSLRLIPISALERLPKQYLAKISTHCFEKLSIRLMHKVPGSLFQKMPRSTLERLHLERLPTELLRKLLEELLGIIQVDISDQIREAIQSSAFEGEKLKWKLLQGAKEILGETLLNSSGELPATVIRVSVPGNSRKLTDEKLLKHEDLQTHILNMTRVHGKMVGQVPFLGMSEEAVYGGLLTKMEEIWQVMRLHPSLLDHF